MAKTKNITRKNRKQRGGIHPHGRYDKKTGELVYEGYNTGLPANFSKQLEEANNLPDERPEEHTNTTQEQTEEKKGMLSNIANSWNSLFSSNQQTTGGNKKQPNPAFGGYLKGGKKHVRNTKKNTKKRTGGNKCNCGCRNCRCSRKDCKCKCADKRFKCTCNSRTCGCKRTLKRRKH